MDKEKIGIKMLEEWISKGSEEQFKTRNEFHSKKNAKGYTVC